jgi:hypothetical protein
MFGMKRPGATTHLYPKRTRRHCEDSLSGGGGGAVTPPLRTSPSAAAAEGWMEDARRCRLLLLHICGGGDRQVGQGTKQALEHIARLLTQWFRDYPPLHVFTLIQLQRVPRSNSPLRRLNEFSCENRAACRTPTTPNPISRLLRSQLQTDVTM